MHLKVKAFDFFFFLPQKSKCSCCSVLESTSEKYFGGLVEHGVIDEQNEFSINVIAFHFVDVVFPPFQLVLEAHNVPELSAGVNCTFEDLAEMDGLVEGNRITCSSPAEKEVPRIVVDQGVYTHVPNSWSRQCQPFFYLVLAHLDISKLVLYSKATQVAQLENRLSLENVHGQGLVRQEERESWREAKHCAVKNKTKQNTILMIPVQFCHPESSTESYT